MKRILAVLMVLFSLSGCAAGEETNVSGYAPGEGQRLILCTSLEAAVWEPLVTEFQDRTGIWVQVTEASVDAALQVPEEWDVLLAPGADALEGREAEFDPGDRGEPWTGVSASPLVLVYNPKLVRIQLPTGWESLLDAVWQGEIAFADPQGAVSSQYALGLMYRLWGGEGVEAFSRSVPELLEDSQSVTEEVADGSYCLGVVTEEAALTAIDAGYSLELLYPEEGSCVVTDCAGVSAQAPHRKSAEEFMAFLLGEDVQAYLETHCGRRRTGGTADDLPGEAFEDVYSDWESCAGLWTRLREETP